MLVDDEELERRRTRFKPAVDPASLRGYLRLYHEQVNQAERGCDFDFMRAARSGTTTP